MNALQVVAGVLGYSRAAPSMVGLIDAKDTTSVSLCADRARMNSNFWDREVIEKQHCDWMAIPRVRLYLNQLIAGGGRIMPGRSSCWSFIFAVGSSIEL